MRWRAAGTLVPGNSIRPEVLVRNKLVLMAAIVLATAGTATGVTAASAAAAASGPCGTATTPHTYQHVVWIWMENHSFTDIIGNKSQAPYINSLAAGCGLATTTTTPRTRACPTTSLPPPASLRARYRPRPTWIATSR